MQWIKLTDRMPNPDEHERVLIYTEGYDFNGEQVFDVKAEALNECFYADPEDQPEECKVASHWMPHPSNNGSPNWTDEQKAANALHDLMDTLPTGTQTSMTVFRPEVNGQQAGAVKALLMANNSDDLRAAQWVIAHGRPSGVELERDKERLHSCPKQLMTAGAPVV